MPPDIPSSRLLTSKDLALLHGRQTMIEAALDRCMRQGGLCSRGFGGPAQTLFRQLLAYLATGEAPPPDAVMPYRRHAGRFGDALRAVLDDILGTDGSPDLALRCVDAFWDCLRMAARPPSHDPRVNITGNS